MRAVSRPSWNAQVLPLVCVGQPGHQNEAFPVVVFKTFQRSEKQFRFFCSPFFFYFWNGLFLDVQESRNLAHEVMAFCFSFYMSHKGNSCPILLWITCAAALLTRIRRSRSMVYGMPRDTATQIRQGPRWLPPWPHLLRCTVPTVMRRMPFYLWLVDGPKFHKSVHFT